MRRFIQALRDERGQVMVLTVVCMAAMLGFVAFAVDVGSLLRARRLLQTAADSAAIAGAAELTAGDSTAAAQADAAQNGVTIGISGATVTVNTPPQSGAYTGNSSSVEVIVKQNQPTFFISVLNPTPVIARAVATLVPNPTCIYTLSSSPPGGSGISLANGANISAPNCIVLDNATGSEALSVQSSTITAKSIGVVGSADTSAGGTASPSPLTGVASVTDPLSYLTAPSFDPASCSPNPNWSDALPHELSPATCYNGLSITGSGAITINPGVYVINGAINFGGSSQITGSGVTFYLTSGANPAASQISNGPTLSLAAPTTGTNQGILFFQDPNDTQSMNFTTGNATINGIFYLPNGSLNFTGAGPATFNSTFVVGSFSLSGDSFTFNTYSASPIAIPRLTE